MLTRFTDGLAMDMAWQNPEWNCHFLRWGLYFPRWTLDTDTDNIMVINICECFLCVGLLPSTFLALSQLVLMPTLWIYQQREIQKGYNLPKVIQLPTGRNRQKYLYMTPKSILLITFVLPTLRSIKYKIKFHFERSRSTGK